MITKYTLLTCAVTALLLCSITAVKAEDVDVEHTTVSPIADMALVDTQQVLPVMEPSENKPQPAMVDSAQPHTIADFIIHPLIALKPRLPEEPAGEGKQATSSTTPSPWQLFGFNAGQGLGSSVSSLAGTVTGWLGNRIQLPGLVDTPVRESTSTSTTTTTTTTPRPDVVVRVQHRSTRRPLIQIGNRPNRFNDNSLNDSEEYLDENEYDDGFGNNNRDKDDGFGSNIRDHDDDDEEEDDDFEDDDVPRDDEEDPEEDDDEEEEERPIRKNKPKQRRRRPSQGTSNRRGSINEKRRLSNGQSNRNQKRRRPQDSQEEEDNEVEEVEEDEEDDEDDDDNDDDDNHDQDFYYNGNSGSSKRSQNQQNFIQRGQQSLINQIRQLTRGQSPVEVASSMRKGITSSNTKKRRQQATLIINRNGQTIYLAPELLESSDSANQNPYYTSSTTSANKRPVMGYPQPPLTVPFKRKGKPTQYITIPWTQLGISPPNQLVSLTEGIQSQPLILNIPQSAIEAMQNPKPAKRKPAMTSEAVPLLAEASLMDVFKPPQIPHNRTPTPVKVSKKTTATVTPVLIATKTKQRVRPGTIVEMSPAVDNPNDQTDSSTETSSSPENESEGGQYILVGEDGESGLGRHAFPILGETRQYAPFTPYFNLFHARQYTGRNGRQLKDPEGSPMMAAMPDMVPQSEHSKEPQMKVTFELAKEDTFVKNINVVEEPLKTASVGKVIALEEPITADVVAQMTTVEEPSKEAPVMGIAQSVEVPMMNAPAVQSSEQVIPVQVVTSDSPTVKRSEGVTFVKETKYE